MPDSLLYGQVLSPDFSKRMHAFLILNDGYSAVARRKWSVPGKQKILLSSGLHLCLEFISKGWISALCTFQTCFLGLTYAILFLWKKGVYYDKSQNRIDPQQEYFRVSLLTSLVVNAKNPPAIKDESEVKPQRTSLYPFGIKTRYSLIRELENVDEACFLVVSAFDVFLYAL